MYRVIGTEEFDVSFNKIKIKAISGNGQAIELTKLIEKGIEKLKYDYKYGGHITKNKFLVNIRKNMVLKICGS